MTNEQFSLYWGLLCEKHRVTPSAPLTRLYALTIKGEGLTAAEWGEAVAASIRFDQFMPGIQQLIDYARGSIQTQALSEWDACLGRMLKNEAATLPDTEARRIMNLCTNGRPLDHIEKPNLPFVKREFVERYTEHLTRQAQARTRGLTAPARPQELPNAAD